jgi:hypothetical protein
MSKQLSLQLIEEEKIEKQTKIHETTAEPQIAFKALRTPRAKRTAAATQEAEEKTNTILEIAQNHPGIVVKSGRLPAGYIISYHLKGGSILTKHESESEFIQKIKKAIPKNIRDKHDYFRGTITRELDSLTVWVGPNFRFCPVKNVHEVISLFENAKTGGVGKKEISINGIIDEFMQHKDEINARAEELGISERIETRELLEKKIRFVPLIFDISFDSAAMGIDSGAVAGIKSEMEKEFRAEIEGDLKTRMQKVLETLSRSLKTIKTSKKGKNMHKRTHDALLRNMEEIEKLNITENDELKNMINLSKALTEALATQDMRTPAKTIDTTTSKTPEEIFAEAFRKSAPVSLESDGDKALNSVIEKIASQL